MTSPPDPELMSDEELRYKCAIPRPAFIRGRALSARVRCNICIYCEEWNKRQRRKAKAE